MTRRQVLVTGGIPADYTGLLRLEQAGLEVVPAPRLRPDASEEDVIGVLNGVWGVIAGNEPYTERVFAAAPGLRVIARPGIGYDAVAIDSASKRGVLVFNTPGINQNTVADFTLLLILACLRNLPLLDRMVRSGKWQPNRPSESELSGSTVGIVGLGAIGKALTRRLNAFGCKIVAVEPKPDTDFCQEHHIEIATLNDLLPIADVVTLHVPLTADTFHMLSDPEFARMKASAIVINTSRGQVIDEKALTKALQDRIIAGAGLDVYESEPLLEGHPLSRLDNVVLTGHVASHTSLTMRRMFDAAIQGILDVAGGQIPDGCLNPQALTVS